MKKQILKNLLSGLAGIMLVAGTVSCDENNGGYNPGEYDELYSSILNQYVTSTIIPTYKSLAEAALEMRAANEALKNEPNDINMKAASDAWMKARVHWELSEAFLFGPVGEHALDIDGHIDSWPLELNDIIIELKKIENDLKTGGRGLTGKTAWQMDAEVIGFHVTEYFLYRDGQSRPAADLSEAELNYLTAATDALVWDCVLAYVAWVGESKVSDEIKEVFNENPDVVAHLNKNSGYKNFAERLTSATGYSSIGNAMAEIAVGAAEIAGEVGSTKIESPYSTGKTEDVESWYSWHSLDDYQNNIISIKNAYLGGAGVDGIRTSISLSTYITMKNPQLDQKIKDKIEECIDKIVAIGTGGKSFYEVVRDQINKTQVDAAVKACLELQTLFAGIPDMIE